MTDEPVTELPRERARRLFDAWMQLLRRDPMCYETSTKAAARAYQEARLRAQELAPKAGPSRTGSTGSGRP